jgi:transposase-like protein
MPPTKPMTIVYEPESSIMPVICPACGVEMTMGYQIEEARASGGRVYRFVCVDCYETWHDLMIAPCKCRKNRVQKARRFSSPR